MRSVLFLCFLSIASLIASGCSSSNPVFDDTSQSSISNSGLLSVVVTDQFADGSIAAGQGTLGLFNISINTETLEGEIVSLRGVSLTDVLEVVDITNFMQLAPCNDCVKLNAISVDSDGNIVLSIGIKHPFEEGDPFKPITGRNRGDLHVFNVEGIVISDGLELLTFPGFAKSVGNTMLLNADGYTGYLDSSIDSIYNTNANIHPYVLHFRDYSQGNFNPDNPMGFESVTTPPPSGNLVMAMGSDYDYQDYVFGITDGSFNFTFAVGCTYPVASATKNERFNPEYRIPQHLKKAASEVNVEVTRNMLMPGVLDSEADIRVSVVDPSHGVPVGTGLDQMLAESNVASVMIDIPGILQSTVEETTPSSGTGNDPSDPLVFDFTIQNESNGDPGTYYGLVKVLDSYAPGQNTSPLLEGKDGIERVNPIDNPLTGLFEITEFATYQLFNIDIMFENTDPVVGEIEGCPRVIVDLPFVYTVDAYDPDPGQQLTYYWDFGQDSPGEYDDDITTEGEVEITYTIPGAYTIDVRVDDGFGGIAYSSQPLQVEVLPYGTFVDADYTGGSSDGTLERPYTVIQTGIDNTSADGYVFVLPAENHYQPFSISGETKQVLGFDLDCGILRPEIDVYGSHPFISSADNSSIESFVFNLNISTTGGDIITLSNSDNVSFKNSRITGETIASNTTTVVLSNVTNSLVQGNEWVNIRLNASPELNRRVNMLRCSGCSYTTVMHNEIHDIGVPDLGYETTWSGVNGIRFGHPTGINNVATNNLIYDIWDHSTASPGVPGNQGGYSNVLHAFSAGNQDGFVFTYNTIDNFDPNNGNQDINSWTVGIYGGMIPNTEISHNIFKGSNYYNGPVMIYHNSAGFWFDSTDMTYATHSCVYWGNPPPPGYPCQTYSYLNRCGKGTGSYDQNDLVDPDFDYTPGPTYYHPQNTLVSQGGIDGGQMGCFGGEHGDWTPPSQIYN